MNYSWKNNLVIKLLPITLVFTSLLNIPKALGGTYKTMCSFAKLAEMEKEMLSKRRPGDDAPTKIKRNSSKCYVPVEVTPEAITSPETSIPMSKVTSWVKTGYSHRRVNTGVTTTILFGPLGALSFISKKHQYSFLIKGFDSNGKKASIQMDFYEKQAIERLSQELPLLTGLAMGEEKSFLEIMKIKLGFE